MHPHTTIDLQDIDRRAYADILMSLAETLPDKTAKPNSFLLVTGNKAKARMFVSGAKRGRRAVVLITSEPQIPMERIFPSTVESVSFIVNRLPIFEKDILTT